LSKILLRNLKPQLISSEYIPTYGMEIYLHDKGNFLNDRFSIIIICFLFRAMSNELKELKQKIKVLEVEKNNLIKKVDEVEMKYENILRKIFTPGQMKKLKSLQKNKKIKWSTEDIASAISLRSVSPKAYRYLRAHNYPLPGLSTLRTRVSNFNVDQGVLQSVIYLMKTKASDFTDTDRLCVLSFDEIYISNRIDFDKKNEQAVGPHRACQTIFVRGLLSNWKQPVFYKFDQPITEAIIKEIISQLFFADFKIVAIVSDLGTSNTGLWSKLNVGQDENCFFYIHATVPQKFLFSQMFHI